MIRLAADARQIGLNGTGIVAGCLKIHAAAVKGFSPADSRVAAASQKHPQGNHNQDEEKAHGKKILLSGKKQWLNLSPSNLHLHGDRIKINRDFENLVFLFEKIKYFNGLKL
jgi:hypothetical protein